MVEDNKNESLRDAIGLDPGLRRDDTAVTPAKAGVQGNTVAKRQAFNNNSLWTNPLHFLAFGCGLGAMPWAPGTFGTLLGIPLFLVLQPLGLITYLIATVALTIIGTWLCHVTGKDIGLTDHPGIVIDEVVGFLWAMVAVPAGGWWIFAGFVLFRVFDILKPWPIRWADQRVPGGVGVMLDDILAALYAWIILQVVVWLIP